MNGSTLSPLLIIVCISTCVHTFGQSREEGLKAAQNGDFQRALAILQPLAEAGENGAQYALGLMYANGQGVTQNYQHARIWYEKAAVQGYGEAQHNLALLYIRGQGGPIDYEEAIVLLLSAARQGSVESLYQLSELYLAGKGRPKDTEGANKLLGMAAEMGHALAHNNLGVSYFTGRGVDVDIVQAHGWFLTAYELWSADKQYYEPGVEESIVSNLRSTTLKMGPGQLTEAQRFSTEWLERFSTVVSDSLDATNSEGDPRTEGTEDEMRQVLDKVGNQSGILQNPIPTSPGLYAEVDDIGLIVWGIFNPMGPTISTLSMIRHDETDQVLLYYRMLNPFRQNNLIVAAFPGNGDVVTILAPILESVEELFRRNGGESYNLTLAMPTFILPLSVDQQLNSMISNFFWYSAHYTDQDLSKVSDLYREFAGKPWDRTQLEVEGQVDTRLDSPREPTQEEYSDWLSIVTSGPHLMFELGSMRAGWSGAIEFQESMGNQAVLQDKMTADEAFDYLGSLGL